MSAPAAVNELVGGELEWKLEAPLPPEGRSENLPEWLEEIQAFRARAFFADTDRAKGNARDADPLDPVSFHILARHRGELLGSIRISFGVGRERGLAFFKDLGFQNADAWPNRIFDGSITSRWATAAGHRSLGLALRLVAGGFALSRYFGHERSHAATATANGQDRILMRCGARPALELGGRVMAERFAQQTYMLYLAESEINPTFEGLIRDMGARLGLAAPAMRRAA